MPSEKNPEIPAAIKRAPRKRARKSPAPPVAPSFVDPQHRAGLIARAAYFRALDRGFAPGREMEDWLAAEAEVDAELMRSAGESSSA